MNVPRRGFDTLTYSQQNIIRSEGWDWESLATWQLQKYISSKLWQVQTARTLVDDQRREARMRYLLGAIKTGLQLKAILYAERGLNELRKRMRGIGKTAFQGRLNPFNEAFLQYLQVEEATLLASEGQHAHTSLKH